VVALGLVIARGGSKGLPRKNVLPLAGRPVLVHTIEAALASRPESYAIISSEDAEILEMARRAGCPAPFVRPADLADDRSSTVAVALHALDWL
jgi:CMP-N-acetylneuraminic acid synthetase